MEKKTVTINAVLANDLAGFLESVGMNEEVKKNIFTCAGCGRTMKIDEIACFRTQKPHTILVFGQECFSKGIK
jgi:hypothetical protein